MWRGVPLEVGMDAVRKILVSAFVVGGLTLVGGVAVGQDGPVPEVGGNVGADGTVYKKETVYDFEGDQIEGALLKPDGALVGGELHGKTSSLIKIRADFIPEMIKSVEDL
jgi:hypothetical protein